MDPSSSRSPLMAGNKKLAGHTDERWLSCNFHIALKKFIECITKKHGANTYKMPHMSKNYSTIGALEDLE